MIVASLRSCLAGLPNREVTAKIGQLLRWLCIRAAGEQPYVGRLPLARIQQHRTGTALVGISAAAAFFAEWKFQHSSKWTAISAADFPQIFRHCSIVL